MARLAKLWSPMPTPSDERMAKLKAAINQCRDGDVHALSGLEISTAELTTISALAKPTVMPLPTTWRNYSSDQWTNRLCSSALNMKSAPAAMQGATRANRLQPITDWRNP